MLDFYLKTQGQDLMELNVKALEDVCKKALNSDDVVVLHSPTEFAAPANLYELTVILAEDMVKKYNENNLIMRN